MAATLWHLGKGVLFSAGTYQPGAKVFYYRTATSTKVPIYTTVAMTIEHSNPVVADSFGKLPAVYLDQDEGNVKYVIAPANDSDPPASAFETVDPFIVSDPVQASTYDPNKTVAEIAAGISTVNAAYPPGDIRRYGAISDGAFDCSSAWQAAIAQAASVSTSPKGASVYVPGSQQGWKITAGATVIGGPFQIYGDNSYYSYVWTNADITPLTIINVHQNAGPVLRDFCLTKSGVSTKPGLHVQNSSHGQIHGMLIRGFHTGVRFEPTAEPPASCYLWSINDSAIIENSSFGILAEYATNYLNLHGVTLASNPIGIRVFEANGFAWYGGDCESTSNIGIDLDSSTEVRMAAIISGVDFENSAGDSMIRIGATALVRGVTVIGCGFYNPTFCNYVYNTERVDRLSLIGNVSNTAPLLSWYNAGGTSVNNVVVFNDLNAGPGGIEILAGTLTYYDTGTPALTGRHADAVVNIPYDTTCTPDAARGNWQSIVIQDAVAFTIAAPINPVAGQLLELLIINGSGGAHGAITWDAIYKRGGALPAIATGFNRTITFRYTGAAWYESFRSPADVPN